MKDQIVWITGASSGIGESVAIALAQRGAKLVLSARREDELQRVKRQCEQAGGAEVLILPLDVCDESAMPASVDKVLESFGHIDLLINNAGISQRSFCKDTEMAVYRKLFEVNVFGQIALTKQVLPHMLSRGSGHIAITASVAGKIGGPSRTGYCATKHAMFGFYDSLRSEVQHQGIDVSTIVPGFIRTNISTNALKGDGSEFAVMDEDIAAGMDVRKAASVIVKGLEKKKKEINVGEGFEMLGLKVKRFLPGVLFNVTAKMGAKELEKIN